MDTSPQAVTAQEDPFLLITHTVVLALVPLLSWIFFVLVFPSDLALDQMYPVAILLDASVLLYLAPASTNHNMFYRALATAWAARLFLQVLVSAASHGPPISFQSPSTSTHPHNSTSITGTMISSQSSSSLNVYSHETNEINQNPVVHLTGDIQIPSSTSSSEEVVEKEEPQGNASSVVAFEDSQSNTTPRSSPSTHSTPIDHSNIQLTSVNTINLTESHEKSTNNLHNSSPRSNQHVSNLIRHEQSPSSSTSPAINVDDSQTLQQQQQQQHASSIASNGTFQSSHQHLTPGHEDDNQVTAATTTTTTPQHQQGVLDAIELQSPPSASYPPPISLQRWKVIAAYVPNLYATPDARFQGLYNTYTPVIGVPMTPDGLSPDPVHVPLYHPGYSPKRLALYLIYMSLSTWIKVLPLPLAAAASISLRSTVSITVGEIGVLPLDILAGIVILLGLVASAVLDAVHAYELLKPTTASSTDSSSPLDQGPSASWESPERPSRRSWNLLADAMVWWGLAGGALSGVITAQFPGLLIGLLVLGPLYVSYVNAFYAGWFGPRVSRRVRIGWDPTMYQLARGELHGNVL